MAVWSMLAWAVAAWREAWMAVSDETRPGEGMAENGKFVRDRARVMSGFWPKLRRLAARLPFLDELVAAYFCALDPATPFKVRAVLMGALAYFVMPVDLIPDFIAALGFADDATVLYGAVKTVAQHITAAHREKAAAAIEKLRG